jgi:hypothetical protein
MTKRRTFPSIRQPATAAAIAASRSGVFGGVGNGSIPKRTVSGSVIRLTMKAT